VAPSDNGPWALQRLFHLGDHVFDRQSYDPASDVLTVWKSQGIDGVMSDERYDSPEGHLPLYDNRGRLVSVDFVDVAARLAAEGAITITLKDDPVPLVADDVVEALASGPGEDDEEWDQEDEEAYPRREPPGELF
jgi:hypothetical protein